MSFKDLLRKKIEKEGYVSYGDLVNFAFEQEHKISTLDRRLRELCNEFPIEALEKKGKKNYFIYAYRLVSEPREEVISSYIISPTQVLAGHAFINGKSVEIFPPLKIKENKEVEQKDRGLGL
jgi:hypothetical protein